MVAGPSARAHRGRDPLGNRVRLVRAGVEGEQRDRVVGARPPRAGALAPRAACRSLRGLEPLRIVVPDEPVGGVEDRLADAEVVGQDDAAPPRVRRLGSRGCSRGPPRGSGRCSGRRHRPPSGCRSASRPAAGPARTGRGSCPGTRRPGCTDSASARPAGWRGARAAGRARGPPGRRSRSDRCERRSSCRPRSRPTARPGGPPARPGPRRRDERRPSADRSVGRRAVGVGRDVFVRARERGSPAPTGSGWDRRAGGIGPGEARRGARAGR